jgi:hypothetical protein
MKKKFNFHGCGTVSKEDMNVIYNDGNILVLSDDDEVLTEDEFLSLNRDKHEFDWVSDYWIFSMETGKCLNDLYTFGCYRTIDVN